MGQSRITFYRLRLGIGHPGHSSQLTGFVLWRAPKAEQEALKPALMKPFPRILPGMIDGRTGPKSCSACTAQA